MSYLRDDLATLRAQLEATYREAKQRRPNLRAQAAAARRKERQERRALIAADLGERRRIRAEEREARAARKQGRQTASRQAHNLEIASSTLAPAPIPEDLGPERYVRVCPRHRCAVTFAHQQDAALCPAGHHVWRWGVFDQQRGEIVAAGSSRRVVLGFDLERPMAALEVVA